MFGARELLTVILATLCLATPAISQEGKLAGYRAGRVERDGKSWRTAITIEPSENGYKAFVDFPDADGYNREFTVSTSSTGRIILTRCRSHGRSRSA